MDDHQKELITLLFDNYLLSANRSFLSLRQANKILKNSSDNYLQGMDLKELLDKGYFPNAKQTTDKPKQWQIFLSKDYTTSKFLPPKKISKKRKEILKVREENIIYSAQKRNGIIAISITVILLCFVWYLSQPSTQTSSQIVSSQYSETTENNNQSSSLESNFKNRVFTYISLENDKEYINDGTLIQTNKEKTIHTFDFINNIVICQAPMNGKYITTKYPINGFYEQNGSYATTYVIKVNTLGVKEIWFSPDVPNLGYDYDNGTRIACYELQVKNE